MYKVRRSSELYVDAGRRKAPRLQTGSLIHAVCADPLVRVREVRNLGAGGFSLETHSGVVPGQQARFQFKTLTGFNVTLAAVAVHCRPSEATRGSYISGWCFTDEQEAEEPVGRMLDFLTSALQFDMDDGPMGSH